MNICIVCHDITSKGGIERVTASLANLFTDQHNQIVIYSVYKQFPQPTFPLNDKIKVVYINRASYPSNKLLRTIKTFVSALKLKRTIGRPQLIIAQSSRCAILCWMIGLARNTIVCEHFKYAMYNRIVTKIRNYIYRQVLQVVALTNSDRDKFISSGVQATTIPNVCSLKIKTITNDHTSKKIISIGRLHFQKGFDLLLKALPPVFEQHPDWSLEIYGEGEKRESLIGQMTELNLSHNVRFMGYSDNISEALDRGAFFVLSSRYEGFPMCLIEAMAHRLAVVSFDCPEGPSVLLKNDGGILVENENIDALTAAINYMIENPDKRIEFSDRAVKNILELSPDNIYQLWSQLFSKLNLLSQKSE